jgi:hypothetical protein
VKNVKEIKSNLQNKHATAHWCWQGGGAGWEAKLSLCAEFSPFQSWHRKYVIEKISDVVRERLPKNMKEFKSNLQNKPASVHWCWQGGGAGREAKLSPWVEISPLPSWHRKYVIEKNIRCSKRNMSKKGEGI